MRYDKAYLDDIVERIFRETLQFKEQGGKVVAVYCAFTPKEIIAAAGAVPVSLCAGSDRPIAAAEAHLPRNLCPLIKSSYGFGLTDTCPYFHETDYILADLTCDGKKKMFELLARLKPVHTLHLPQIAGTSESLAQWRAELATVRDLLQEFCGRIITDDDLRGQIALYNEHRRVMQELYRLNAGPVPLVSGTELEFISDPGGFELDLARRMDEMRAAIADIRRRSEDASYLESMRRRPRILITGCPTTNRKLLEVIETSGGVVVAMENCGGLKTVDRLVHETDDPLTALAEKYLAIPCACMTPNTTRLDLIADLAREFHIEGVVELTWSGCHTYNVEAFSVREHVQDRLGLPYLQVETDYSESDTERLRLRVQAFLELVR
jgi:benzoyl-CoA reductase/2-hydroxyglutaryl-CoA dehydratase subunit BcrC/BadD/HgdB